ncbi:MAG: DEAD/DEAH box helicase [Patescibacteria group bacterium]|nr:DEAD/DEAH box helicase [Patescibacteria group bacterium]
MQVYLDTSRIADYRTFMRIKSLPTYRITGHVAEFSEEYGERIGLNSKRRYHAKYEPINGLFDYQTAIVAKAIAKRKYAVFADCGLGKTLIFLEYARYVRGVLPDNKSILIISPLMVIDQTLAECERWYGSALPIERVRSSDLREWLQVDTKRIGITNYEALRSETSRGNLGCLILDESSMLKSHYGKFSQECIRLGKGLEWKLALTGTPAPNDRIEYGNHAVFLDQSPNTNAFLARYFVNRGQTNERWELKPHALHPFYRSLSHWCIFLNNPGVYGWRDNSRELPPIRVHVHHVDLTDAQTALVSQETGALFATNFGGITSRSTLARIAKGSYRGKPVETLKPDFIRRLVDSFGDKSSIVWCLYNDEQDALKSMMPRAANIDGRTPPQERQRLIGEFKTGRIKTLISKPKILGFGLNLQIATRQVFSSLQDSYESYYQAVKRSNRYGSTECLEVHIPVTELEIPMVETVLRKAGNVQQDTQEQERLFSSHAF